MGIAGVGEFLSAVGGEELIDIAKAGEVADKAVMTTNGAFAAGGEILRAEQILIGNDGRAHGPVFVSTGAIEKSIFLPHRKAHPLII